MFPYEIKPVEDNLNKELMNDFKGERYGFVQVGPKKWCLPASYKMHAEKFYTYPLRADDIWIMTYPRSGTTLCQELVWLLNNDLDYDTAARVALEKRFPFFEFALLYSDKLHKEINEMNNYDPVIDEKIAFWRKPVYEWDMPSPRHLKTHLPFSLLPPDLIEKCKTIYVARNPRDVAVSYYHHNKLVRVHDFKGDFKKYWKYFTKDLLVFSPYWEHLKEAWELRKEKNVLFLFYENLVNNTAESIKHISEFLGKSISNEEIINLCEHLKIDNFRKNVIVHKNIPNKGVLNDGEQKFLRNGKVGGNEEFFEEIEMSTDDWMKSNLVSIDLKFPVKI